MLTALATAALITALFWGLELLLTRLTGHGQFYWWQRLLHR